MREPMTAGSIAIHLALGIAGFVATAALLERVLPEREVTDVSPKLRAIRQADPPFDVLFLGNSRVYYQMDPRAFDDAVRAAGGPSIRSYNLGSNAVSVFESHHLLAELLADPRTRPRAVVWDLAIRPCAPARDRETLRFAYWHGAEETWRAVVYELGDAVALGVRLDRVGRHVGAFADRAIGRGRLVEAARRLAAPTPGAEPPVFDDRGYVAMRDDRDPGAARKRAVFLEALARGEWPPPRQQRDATRRESLTVEWVVALMDRHGVVPILTVSPIGDDVSSPLGRATAVLGHPVLRFDDAAAYPELHQPGAYYDATHLDREGGRLLVRALAQRIVPDLLPRGDAR